MAAQQRDPPQTAECGVLLESLSCPILAASMLLSRQVPVWMEVRHMLSLQTGWGLACNRIHAEDVQFPCDVPPEARQQDGNAVAGPAEGERLLVSVR